MLKPLVLAVDPVYGYVSPRPAYSCLVESFAYIEAEEDTGNYQGDLLFLLRHQDGRPGFLVFGYGSCSACDSLAACNTVEDYLALRDEMASLTRWFHTDAERLAFLKQNDADHVPQWFHYGKPAEVVQKFVERLERDLP